VKDVVVGVVVGTLKNTSTSGREGTREKVLARF